MAKVIGATISRFLIASPASAFDLQGHRGARGLAPENSLEGFRARVVDRGVDARARSRHDQGRRAGRQPRPPSQSRSHPRPDGKFLDAGGRPSTHSPWPSSSATTSAASSPAPPTLRPFPSSRAWTASASRPLRRYSTWCGGRTPTIVRFNIETKITPTSGADTPDPELRRRRGERRCARRVWPPGPASNPSIGARSRSCAASPRRSSASA